MDYFVGIDEAGRGSIIGSMYMASIVLSEENKKYLSSLGVDDSKKITKNKRYDLFDIIKNNCIEYDILKATPRKIEANNINQIEMSMAVSLVNSIKTDVKTIILDAHTSKEDKDLEKFYIYGGNKRDNISFIKKADTKYIEVSAASILAKVSRDKEMDGLDINCSGYADKNTKEYLREFLYKNNFLPEYVRYSWGPIMKMLCVE